MGESVGDLSWILAARPAVFRSRRSILRCGAFSGTKFVRHGEERWFASAKWRMAQGPGAVIKGGSGQVQGARPCRGQGRAALASRDRAQTCALIKKRAGAAEKVPQNRPPVCTQTVGRGKRFWGKQPPGVKRQESNRIKKSAYIIRLNRGISDIRYIALRTAIRCCEVGVTDRSRCRAGPAAGV